MAQMLDVILWPIYVIGIGGFVLGIAVLAAVIVLLVWLVKRNKKAGKGVLQEENEPLQGGCERLEGTSDDQRNECAEKDARHDNDSQAAESKCGNTDIEKGGKDE